MTQIQSRFLAALALLLTGSVLGVGALLFGPATERWLGLALGAAALLVVLVTLALPGRGAATRVLELAAALVAIWSMVSSRTIALAINGASPHLVRWLGLSAGAALAGLGLLALIVHEATAESDLRWARDRLAERAGDLAGARAETATVRAALAETEAALAETEAELHDLRAAAAGPGSGRTGSPPARPRPADIAAPAPAANGRSAPLARPGALRSALPGPFSRARAALHGTEHGESRR